MTKRYWIICTHSYEVDGTEISKGSMKYHTSTRPVISNYWRLATQDEINTKQWVKGKYFNLKNV